MALLDRSHESQFFGCVSMWLGPCVVLSLPLLIVLCRSFSWLLAAASARSLSLPFATARRHRTLRSSFTLAAHSLPRSSLPPSSLLSLSLTARHGWQNIKLQTRAAGYEANASHMRCDNEEPSHEEGSDVMLFNGPSTPFRITSDG